jgi:tetratricopeptide (TPR) repeat protein
MGTTEKDHHLKQLQIRCFLREIEVQEPDSKVFLTLGRLLLEQLWMEMDDKKVAELLALLEKGTAIYPDDIQILEMLLAGKVWFEPFKDHHDQADMLARLSPHSPLLSICADRKKNEAVMYSGISGSFGLLIEALISGDEELREYVLKDMAGFVVRDPTNTDYRIMYAIALAKAKDYAGALKQVDKAEQDPNKGYTYYFNVSQIFHICGNDEKALEYTENAKLYVETEEDRVDLDKVIDRITNVGA